MRPLRGVSHPHHEFAVLCLCLILLLGAEFLGVFGGLNRSLYDLSFRLRGPAPADRSIVIAALDDQSLIKFGRWPIQRTHYSRLLDAFSEARAVGLDVILSEATEDDQGLAEAVRRHGRVVLTAAIRKGLDVEPPLAPLADVPRGHVYVEPGTDGIVREVFHTIRAPGAVLSSFSSLLYERARGAAMTSAAIPPLPEGSKALFQRDGMLIDFYGPPGTYDLISAADIEAGLYPPRFFKDKIVLVGVTAAGLEDRLMIPFTGDRNTMPGVEIHAHILNNLLDGRRITPLGRGALWPLVFLGGILFYAFLRRRSDGVTALAWGVSLALIAAAAFILFSRLEIWIHPELLLTVSILVFVLAYVFRLNEAAHRLDGKYLTLNARLGWPLSGERPSVQETGLAGFLSSRGIQAKISRLLKAEQAYEGVLEETVRRRTEDLSKALDIINQMSNEMIVRLMKAVESKERGTGEHITRIGMYAKKVAEFLGLPSDQVELISFASSMHDLGKIGIPDEILLKDRGLSREEYEIMKEHTRIGENILSHSVHPKIRIAASIALNHHEKWNGAGYPQGLRGPDIPFEARIVAICDQYDSLRSPRPYKDSFNHEKTLRIILEGDGRTSPEHFDPDILKAFLDLAPFFKEIYDRNLSLA